MIAIINANTYNWHLLPTVDFKGYMCYYIFFLKFSLTATVQYVSPDLNQFAPIKIA